jgi:hypothetical protein
MPVSARTLTKVTASVLRSEIARSGPRSLAPLQGASPGGGGFLGLKPQAEFVVPLRGKEPVNLDDMSRQQTALTVNCRLL